MLLNSAKITNLPINTHIAPMLWHVLTSVSISQQHILHMGYHVQLYKKVEMPIYITYVYAIFSTQVNKLCFTLKKNVNQQFLI